MANQVIRLTESELINFVKRTAMMMVNEWNYSTYKSDRKSINESIVDDADLMIQKERYGSFWIRDKKTWLTFNAEVWIDNDTAHINLYSQSDDRRASQMEDSKDFQRICIEGILQEYPEHIAGFNDFCEEKDMNYTEAVDYLLSNL